MPPDADPSSQHGTYVSPAGSSFPPPNPARTLVMELLPKKFRNLAFVRSWASTFGPRPPAAVRIDLDVKSGKALIEFATADVARSAWESERLSGEGKEHIRVWWYRVPGIGADAGVGELEEGEIEDGELSKLAGGKNNQAKAKEQTKLHERVPAQPVRADTYRVTNATTRSATTSTMAGPTPNEAPAVSSRQPLFHLPASLPPKPIVFTQIEKVHTLSQQPSGLQAAQVPRVPPPALLAQTTPAAGSSNDVALLQVKPSTGTSAPSMLQATAPVFVPRSQSISAPSTPVPDMPSVVVPTVTTLASMDSMDWTSDSMDGLADIQAVPAAMASSMATSSPRDESVHTLSGHSKDSSSVVLTKLGSPPPPSPTFVFPAGQVTPRTASSNSQAPTAKSDNKPVPSTLAPSGLVAASGLAFVPHPITRVEPSSVRSAMSTPTPPPSEPRAIRNLPKVPSYAKRKEVEEKMAKRREELAARGLASTSSSGTVTPVSEIEAMIVDSPPTPNVETPPPVNVPSAVGVTAAMKEDDLRRLVLNSRKARAALTAPSTPVVNSPPAFVASMTVNEVKTGQISLDDLAGSFIAECIQAVSIPSPVSFAQDKSRLVSPIFSEKALLAAKQKILEENIADQKELMGRYAGARTKADREGVKQAMAERTRYVLDLLSPGHSEAAEGSAQTHGTGDGRAHGTRAGWQGRCACPQIQVARDGQKRVRTRHQRRRGRMNAPTRSEGKIPIPAHV